MSKNKQKSTLGRLQQYTIYNPIFCLDNGEYLKEISPGDVMTNVYNDFKKYPSFAIANLKVNGHKVVRIAPTIFNGVDEIENVVNKTVDVMINMLKGEIPNRKHLCSYA
ncbi:MAG: hypothetical protein SV775_11225 [Thermodesulfobacteriota bacterium]|nr:hypothetical protein [Thermodesulfobacteriota bacterium]